MPRKPARGRGKRTKRAAGSRGREWLKSILGGVLLFLVIRTFLVQTFTIISSSMEDTLLVGDFLVLSKSAYGAKVPFTSVRLPGYETPARGDVVVFRGPAEPIDIVKRLVGMPGDTVSMRGGTLRVNGVALDEPYVVRRHADTDVTDAMMQWQAAHLADPARAGGYHPTRDDWGPLVVPAGHYLMLGDNRDESMDSRYWGFVPHENLKGRALLLYWSWGADTGTGGIPIARRVRWSRIGDRIR